MADGVGRCRWLRRGIISVAGLAGLAGLPSSQAGAITAQVVLGAVRAGTTTVMVAAGAVGIRKHPLGYTTALSSSEVGKIYVPSRYGGVLTLNGNAILYYTNGTDLTASVAQQVYDGSLDSAIVAQGYPCTYTVPAGQYGWFYFLVPGGTSGISNSFVEDGQAAIRPWNGWWWPWVGTSGPTLHDAGGPLDKYDEVYDGGPSPVAGTPFYQENMDSDPGWTTQGAWSWGTPAGNGGDHGGADPTSGFTGTAVYGYNLSGGYPNNLGPTSLTTTAIDCTGRSGVHLRFRRWLCVEQSIYDHASVEVSNDGTSWVTVWDFSGPTMIETGWSLQDYDVSSVADGQPSVYIRWVMGPSDVGWTYGGWNIDDVQLTSTGTAPPPPSPFYEEKLDSNPGWATQGAWAWGVPTGRGGDHGGADPTAGYSGTHVYGYNLSGGYVNNLGPTSLTTTAINCSGQSGVHLRFRRWLCVEESIYDHASVQVSNDGANWATVWDFSGPTLIETGWSLQDYDISAVADDQPTVYIRWVMGPTDVGWTYGGWNIDDVQADKHARGRRLLQADARQRSGLGRAGAMGLGRTQGKGGRSRRSGSDFRLHGDARLRL